MSVVDLSPNDSAIQFDTIEDAIRAYARGELVVVVDDEDRENEGDLMMAAAHATPETVAFMVRHTTGILCTPLSQARAERLALPPMVAQVQGRHTAAFTVSVDYKSGLTTGISAQQRCATAQALARDDLSADDFERPGHMFPLIAKDGGVLERAGHTEAAVDLALLGGLPKVGLLAELVNDDGSVMRLPELVSFTAQHELRLVSIADLIQYRQVHEQWVEGTLSKTVQTPVGKANIYHYVSRLDGSEFVAAVVGDFSANGSAAVRICPAPIADDLVEPDTGDSTHLGSALAVIQDQGAGVVIAPTEQKTSITNVPASTDNSEQRSQAEARQLHWQQFGISAHILRDLGVEQACVCVAQGEVQPELDIYGIRVAAVHQLD